MTVGTLIKKLQKLPKGLKVYQESSPWGSMYETQVVRLEKESTTKDVYTNDSGRQIIKKIKHEAHVVIDHGIGY